MQCPPDIADILLRIIRAGIIQIRLAGWERNPDRCSLEADHIHNLPDLVCNYSADRLKYYWDVERPCFIQGGGSEASLRFARLWDELVPHMAALATEHLIETHEQSGE
jgi:hypothetical protein